MKKSYFFMGLAVVFLLIPQLSLKLDLQNKFKRSDWIFHSAKRIVPMNGITEIELKNIHEFRYEFSKDSSYLEFNEEEAESRYVTKTDGDILRISNVPFKFTTPPNDQNIFNQKFTFTNSLMYSALNINGQLFFISPPEAPKLFSESLMASRKLVFKGKKLPRIKAENSNLLIDSIGENQSFEMDLDFSKCNWENFKKYRQVGDLSNRIYFDRSATDLWKIDTLEMKLKTGTFYFNKDLKFKHISIAASHKADLHFESDDYSNAKITIDSTVLIRAPYSIWKNLKVIETK